MFMDVGCFVFFDSSQMVDLKSLCISKGKAAWMAYVVCILTYVAGVVLMLSSWLFLELMNLSGCCSQDVYCLDADGSLLDAALLAAVAALMHGRLALLNKLALTGLNLHGTLIYGALALSAFYMVTH